MKAITFRLLVLLAVLAVLMVAGTLGFMAIEKIPFVDAFYFTIVTVSTVGYGDIFPATSGGRILAIALIIIGVGTFLGVVANITQLLLEGRQERIRKEHINMAIGVFFSEIGTQLLKIFTAFDADIEQVCQECLINKSWSDQRFAQLGRKLGNHTYNIDSERMELEELQDFLKEKGYLLTQMLSNPYLQERETFTELLRAISHLKEELMLRPGFVELPDTDIKHLAGDLKRAYMLIAREWVNYMNYLKRNYPYLFSLALRTNPFHANISPIVK